jgi:hypothetical protein
MPVELDLHIVNPTLATHEALRVVCRLRNDENARTIPSPYDRSGSFRIGLFQEGEAPVRVMDRQTRQTMMSAGRVDSSLDLDTLDAHGVWTWDVDLASYGYAIPPGRYDLRAVYEYEPEQIHAGWGPQTVQVTADPLRNVRVIRDNPIIDGLVLLFEGGGATRPRWFLRLHNYQRPLGAWWSIPVIEGAPPVMAFCASAGYSQTESTDPFHRRWILSLDDSGLVRANLYDRGEATPRVREAQLPHGARLIPAAVAMRDDTLLVFVWSATGRLQCHRFEDASFVPQFEHAPPYPQGTAISIGADEQGIHLAAAYRGLHHQVLNLAGETLTVQQLFRSRLAPNAVRFEPGEQRIKGLFFEGRSGSLQMVVHRLENGQTHVSSIDRFPVRDDLQEIDFDLDHAGRFHLLASTAGRRLYYLGTGLGPVLVAEGEDRFFPIVAAARQVYLGCYRSAYGYRFVHYQPRQHGPKFHGWSIQA